MVKLAFKPTDEICLVSKSSKKIELNLNPFKGDDYNVAENIISGNNCSPVCTKELVGLENCLYFIKSWFINLSVAKKLIIIGPTGCGKTTLVELFCKENDIFLHSVKTSENKTKKDIIKDIELFKIYYANFFTSRLVKKLVLIDEYQNGQNELNISDIIAITGIPVIIISSDAKGSKLSDLKKTNEVYYINEIPFNLLKTWVNTICKDLPDEKINKLIKNAKSDKRLILNTIQFLKKNNDSFNPSNFYKDTDVNVFEVINNVFDNIEPLDLSEAYSIYESDGYLLAGLIQENYIDYNDSLENVAKAADSISLGETIFSDTYETSKTFLPHLHFISSLAIPSYYSRSDYKKNKCTIRTSAINNRFNIYLNNKKIIEKINTNETNVMDIEDIFYIKRFISRDLIKTKVLSENQLNFLKSIMKTWNTTPLEKLELIYKHFSDFKEQIIKEVKTKNFTIKFKEKLNKLI